MCLIVNKGTKRKTAKTDIIVYKKMLYHSEKNFLRSPFFCQVYELNQLYETTITVETIDSEKCGYDYFTSKMYNGDRCNYTFYGKGFHSAFSLTRLNLRYDEVMVKCIIPKGSKYISDETGLVVSNKLIITDIIENEINAM